jgi:hypothetical protein
MQDGWLMKLFQMFRQTNKKERTAACNALNNYNFLGMSLTTETHPADAGDIGIDSWMPLVVRYSLEKCFSNAKKVAY